MDMSKYRDLFLSEAREHLQGMNTCLLALEKDPQASDSIDELFRHAHSVKGMAASMGYGRLAELAHRMEDVMDSIRKGRVAIDAAFMDLLFSGMDSLDGMVTAVEQDADLEAIDSSQLVARFLAAAEGKPFDKPAAAAAPPSLAAPVAPVAPAASAAPAVSAAPPAPPATGIEVRFTVAADSLVPAARSYLAVRRLEALGEVRELDPPLETIRAGRGGRSVRLRIEGVAAEEIRRLLAGLPEMGEFAVKPAIAPAVAGATAGVDTQDPRPADPVMQGAELPPLPANLPGAKAGKAGPPAPRTSTTAKSVRINVDLLDTFINLVGELIVTKSRLRGLLAGSASRPLDEGLTRLDQLVGTLHAEVMKVRMMPLETVTSRLPRVARDLARNRGKEADLVIEGAGIELDRAILDELGDPLIHILRNAVDHGLEEPEGRRKAGKPPAGRITIRAFRERDMVHVEVSDDGRGMDIGRIRAKAVEKGIIDAEQAKDLSEEEAIMLVCRPGFSTLDQVTDVSGRGVGMDVVRSVVESLGGNLVIRTRSGEGTTFLLKLPLTVAIVKMLLVGVQSHSFAIPITRVLRTVRVTTAEVQQSQRKRYLTLGEELIPLFETRALMSIAGSFPEKGALTVVLVEATNRTVGLLVDEILGQEDIVIKPLCFPLEYLARYSGMTVLGDGRVVPILDLKNLIA